MIRRVIETIFAAVASACFTVTISYTPITMMLEEQGGWTVFSIAFVGVAVSGWAWAMSFFIEGIWGSS